jgi:hypothetical protein
MLRNVVIGLGVVALACGAAALLAGVAPGFVFLFWGGVIVLSVVYERVRYKPIEETTPGPGWTRTAERFIDDQTGETVSVWLDPVSGERKYVKG